MTRHLLIDPSGIVTNVVECDPAQPFVAEGYRVILSDTGEVGHIWDGEKVVDPNPSVEVAQAIVNPGVALSKSPQTFSGRFVEFAVFARVGSKIAPHVHETGHYAIHVNGRIRTQAEGQEPVVLTSVGQSVYFPAGVKHWLEAEEAGSVCLQVHDVARNA